MTDQKTQKPEWVPENAGGEFACRVMPAADYTTAEASVRAAEQKVTVKKLSAQDYADGILNGNRMLLAKAITLVESNAPKHFDLAQEIIRLILPYAGKAKRVGITGVPGAGKSTFIEAIGCYLCQQGHLSLIHI